MLVTKAPETGRRNAFVPTNHALSLFFGQLQTVTARVTLANTMLVMQVLPQDVAILTCLLKRCTISRLAAPTSLSLLYLHFFAPVTTPLVNRLSLFYFQLKRLAPSKLHKCLYDKSTSTPSSSCFLYLRTFLPVCTELNRRFRFSMASSRR